MTNPYDRAEQRPASRLDPDPLHVPDDPTFDKPVIAIGVAWWVLASALVIAAIFAIAALLLAAPRAASETRPVHQVQPGASREMSGARWDDADSSPIEPARGAPQTVIGPPLTVVFGDVPDTATEVRGKASWYCGAGSRCTRGWPAGTLAAAAGPALRVGNWRGRIVRVCSGSRCVSVRLVDWCACRGKVIDLYRVAFARLAPPSRGIIRVTVSHGSLPALPPTGTE